MITRLKYTSIWLLIVLGLLVLSHGWTSTSASHQRVYEPNNRNEMILRKLNAAASSNELEGKWKSSPLVLHHAALKTRNITTAIEFYSLLGYTVACKFRAGPARAAWLHLGQEANTVPTVAARLELIEVPSYMLQEAPGTRQRAVDLMQRQDVLGYNHVALDVTNQIESNDDLLTLADWIDRLNEKSLKTFGKSLRIALEPRQQMIGRGVYELGFVYDADGCLVELIHLQGELSQDVDSGWEPWDGQGFVGLAEENRTL